MKRKEVKLGGAAAVQAVPDTDDEDLREGPSPKSRKGEMSGAGVTLEALQAMMEAQTRTLMERFAATSGCGPGAFGKHDGQQNQWPR